MAQPRPGAYALRFELAGRGLRVDGDPELEQVVPPAVPGASRES